MSNRIRSTSVLTSSPSKRSTQLQHPKTNNPFHRNLGSKPVPDSETTGFLDPILILVTAEMSRISLGSFEWVKPYLQRWRGIRQFVINGLDIEGELDIVKNIDRLHAEDESELVVEYSLRSRVACSSQITGMRSEVEEVGRMLWDSNFYMSCRQWEKAASCLCSYDLTVESTAYWCDCATATYLQLESAAWRCRVRAVHGVVHVLWNQE
jgi:hypothetical protein